jgi:hypothetical protein
VHGHDADLVGSLLEIALQFAFPGALGEDETERRPRFAAGEALRFEQEGIERFADIAAEAGIDRAAPADRTIGGGEAR